MSEVHDPISALPPLREIIRDHGLREEKSLGQNFLLDLNLTGKIARAAGELDGVTVFEIGPGPGGLTRAILSAGPKKLIAIEYDPRAIAALQSLKNAAGGRLEIVQQDALHANLPVLAAEHGGSEPYAVIANLPYNIATPLLTGWLEDIYNHPDRYSELVLMFQKEVAQRIVGKAGSKTYGRLSILSQFVCDTKLMFDVPAAAFTPPPKVTSSIVRLVPKKPEKDRPAFQTIEKLTAAAFGQRRKMIRGSLKEYLPHIESCGLRPEARAEELSVEDFIKLAKAIAS
ncbi:MAG: 16S rRNA (adenine(1518)-N(6)/adenine(1519)-N(6))-dimethyltransferase [Micavibrio aeruginosavorus]|uniref:Ribosomal RNA small subunit methyltransferase A n=1 Tax=Micavibrio aeruginosavorus TaxID=349221 RepID=A0A2W5Q8C7_9BACT|nr:MAG: 16S rRNA (adenine(1518)-N(6)/adenine(1519)-N(6))-dimethyltransferase [Micavibrio aeruginosavorus]